MAYRSQATSRVASLVSGFGRPRGNAGESLRGRAGGGGHPLPAHCGLELAREEGTCESSPPRHYTWRLARLTTSSLDERYARSTLTP